jgi:hypothetical protein
MKELFKNSRGIVWQSFKAVIYSVPILLVILVLMTNFDIYPGVVKAVTDQLKKMLNDHYEVVVLIIFITGGIGVQCVQGYLLKSQHYKEPE